MEKIYETEIIVQVYYNTIFFTTLSNIIGPYIEYAPLLYCFSWKQTTREGENIDYVLYNILFKILHKDIF